MKKILPILLALFTTMMFFGACSSNTPTPPTINPSNSSSEENTTDNIKRLDMTKLAQNIDNAAQYDISNHKIFGSAYYVYQNGVEFEKCYGTTSLNTDTPITNTSIFRLASMTKPITTVATLILAERGLLSLDDSIDKYLPQFKNVMIVNGSIRTKPQNLPTIRNILNHTSGIGGDATKLAAMTAYDKKTLDNSIAFFVNSGLDFEPGSKQMYSGTGSFDVLTKIIEIVSEMDYAQFLQDYVFKPCGMVDTTFTPTAEQQKRMVDMHNKVDGENAVAQMPEGCVFEDYPTTHYLGGAGLVSTLSDYSKFAKMLLNKGKTDTATILKEETFNQLCTPQVPYEIMPTNARWGLGVRVITEASYPSLPVGSFGWSGAYGSHFWIDPENKVFAVYMKNSKFDGGAANESAVNFEKAVHASFLAE